MRGHETRLLWQRTSFVWGETDCIMSVCNHVWQTTGVDPAAPWRGTYSDEAGAAAIYGAHGGVLGLMRHGMALAGFATGEAQDGAVVVCQMGPHEIAGLMFGRRFGFMFEGSGLIETRAKVLEAWAI